MDPEALPVSEAAGSRTHLNVPSYLAHAFQEAAVMPA